MRLGESVWAVMDTRRGRINEIFEGDIGLPLIFDNENDALDAADLIKYTKVEECRIQSLSVY